MTTSSDGCVEPPGGPGAAAEGGVGRRRLLAYGVLGWATLGLGVARILSIRPGAPASGVGLPAALASAGTPGEPSPPLVGGVVEVVATLSADGTHAYFDPVGLWVPSGTVVRWRVERSVHTVTAYHPANGNRELRIPERAQAWDSGYLTEEPGRNAFEYRFVVPGVYDYFCQPHELAGMVGRIVVGEPGSGPGTRPFGWGGDRWQPVPEEAQRAFPPVSLIVERRVVRAQP